MELLGHKMSVKAQQDPKAETLGKQRPAALIFPLRHMTSTFNNYSLQLTAFDAQKNGLDAMTGMRRTICHGLAFAALSLLPVRGVRRPRKSHCSFSMMHCTADTFPGNREGPE